MERIRRRSTKELRDTLTEATINIVLVREGVRGGALMLLPDEIKSRVVQYALDEGLHVTPLRIKGKQYDVKNKKIVVMKDVPKRMLFFTREELPASPLDEAEIASILGYHQTNFDIEQKKKGCVKFHEKTFDVSMTSS